MEVLQCNNSKMYNNERNLTRDLTDFKFVELSDVVLPRYRYGHGYAFP